jgi:hypothetical protein
MNRRYSIAVIISLAFLCIISSNACAKIQLGAIPAPPPVSKLRVYIQPHSTVFEGRGKWGVPDEKFIEDQVRIAARYLSETGIYEIVSKEEELAVLRDLKPTRSDMERNDAALAREIGRALHTDYVMMMERGVIGITRTQYFVNVLINVESGEKFGARYNFSKGGLDGQIMKRIMHQSYRDIFRDAKEDLLASAVRKSEGRTGSAGKQEAEPAEKNWIKEFEAEKALTQDADQSTIKGARLVVYDLDSSDQHRPVALILSEALREELFRLKQFVLVNREDLEKVLKEMALQQTGLVDEKEAVKTGKGLAANQVVTGKLGLLGKTFVLQAKRIDVESFATLGLSSAKFSQGQEDEVLGKLGEVAKSLAGNP